MKRRKKEKERFWVDQMKSQLKVIRNGMKETKEDEKRHNSGRKR